MDRAQRARADHFHRPAIRRPVVVDVIAHLRDALVLQCRVHHRASLADGIGQRLLDEDVLAGLARVDGRQRVPVVRRRHHHRIEVFALQQLAEIAVHLRLAAACLLHDCGGTTGMRLVHVANRRGIHIGIPQELVEPRRALASESDEPDLQPVGRRGTESCRGHLHKGPSAEFRHQQPD